MTWSNQILGWAIFCICLAKLFIKYRVNMIWIYIHLTHNIVWKLNYNMLGLSDCFDWLAHIMYIQTEPQITINLHRLLIKTLIQPYNYKQFIWLRLNNRNWSCFLKRLFRNWFRNSLTQLKCNPLPYRVTQECTPLILIMHITAKPIYSPRVV